MFVSCTCHEMYFGYLCLLTLRNYTASDINNIICDVTGRSISKLYHTQYSFLKGQGIDNMFTKICIYCHHHGEYGTTRKLLPAAFKQNHFY